MENIRGVFICIFILMIIITGSSMSAIAQLYAGVWDGRIIRIDPSASSTIELAQGLGRVEDGVCSPMGWLYFADTSQRKIYRLRGDGNFLTTIFESERLSPEGLSLDGEGNLIFNTTSKDGATPNGVWMIRYPYASQPGQPKQIANTNVMGEGTLILNKGPFKGHLLAAVGDKIIRVAPEDFSFQITDGNFIVGEGPVGLAQDPLTGDIFISFFRSGEIHRYTPTGDFVEVFISGLVDPTHLEFDELGNLYVSELNALRVLKIDKNGNTEVILSGYGISGLAYCGVPKISSIPLSTPIQWIILSLLLGGLLVRTILNTNTSLSHGQDGLLFRVGDGDRREDPQEP